MSSVSADRQSLERNSIVGDDPVTNGNVDNYDFDWGEEVRTEGPDLFSRCSCCLGEETVPEMEQSPNPQMGCSCQVPENPTPEVPCEETEPCPTDANYQIIDL